MTTLKRLKNSKKNTIVCASNCIRTWVVVTNAMKQLNAEYEILFERVKRIHVNKDGETYERDTEETPEEFQTLIAELLKLDNITIEIIGCFVWVAGDNKPHKEKLKELGFKWHNKKKCWYKSPEGYRRWGGGEYSMDDIRGMYKSVKVQLSATAAG